ncbi:MAG: UDP-galactopyranose mutase [Ignavibacterium sp.]|nr:UDP-galactopyranose mutase [Ignavibacterium sp.]
MIKCDFLIVGSGFAGSVLAERISNELKKDVLIVEKRNHIGGNCYDEFDENGILIHKYGPHIFHTNDKNIIDYLSQFTDWYEYEHRVLAFSEGEYYPMPINRNTINKVFNKNFSTDEEVKEFLNQIREERNPIKNSEDIIVNQVGWKLFDKFFRHYTKKQWNLEPKYLSPGVCGRIRIRSNSDDRYFEDKYQVMPKEGFTKIFEKMLDNKRIKIILNKDFKEIINEINYKYLIYTGPIDYLFNYKFGKLTYRSIRFEFRNFNKISHQPVAVVNYVDKDIPYTRVTEYKKITNQNSSSTTLSFEYPNSDGEPLYPLMSNINIQIFNNYLERALQEKNLILCGRLAEFRYYEMQQVIARALKIFQKVISKL